MKICVQALTDNLHRQQREDKKTDIRKWGDFWFQKHVRGALHSIDEETVTRTKYADASILLQGKFWTSKCKIKSVWVCGNVECISTDVYQNYFDIVWTLSDKYTKVLQDKGIKCRTLLPATDYIADPVTDKPKDEIIYVGNIKEGAYQSRYDCVKALSKSGIKINVIGDGWMKYRYKLPRMNRLYTYHRHQDYPKLFSDYKLALYVHAPDMTQWNFVALRILDMMATGNCLVISDHNEGLKEMFGDLIPMYRNPQELVKIAQHLLRNEKERKERWQKAREIIREKHKFRYRAEEMMKDIRAAWSDKFGPDSIP